MNNIFSMIRNSFFLFASTSSFALTTLVVSSSSDNDPGGFGNAGELRYCLNTMNQNLNGSIDDYAISFAFPMTIQLNGILPIINDSLNPVSITIGNPGSIPTVTIDGNSGSYNGFLIPTGNVTIQNMIFQNLTAKGGNGGDGISGGGGGMGAGGAILAPQTFLNGSNPSITLMNVSINNCSAIGGNGGNYLGASSTGDEGGGGGGGFSGNGGSITTSGNTGGAGGGGFGGDGGNVTLSTGSSGGGGGGGGGIGSRASLGTLANLGNGGSDQTSGTNGNIYGPTIFAGSGAGGNNGGGQAGGGGGGNPTGGGGGGSAGTGGTAPHGSTPPGGGIAASGGNGGDGGGGGGGGVVITGSTNSLDGGAGSGGYGGGGGGGAGTGATDVGYTVKGGAGGVGGGGGGGGVDQSGTTAANGGNSLGGGGGGGGGPSNGSNPLGGSDTGSLGGGAGGNGNNIVGTGSGGGGGGGGSGIGGAIFVDTGLNFTVQAISGIPTIFNTTNNTTQAGLHGTAGSGGGTDGNNGSALGNSIFLRANSSLTFIAQDSNDLLTLGDGVSFVDDTIFGAGGTSVRVTGNGTVIYNGVADYQGSIQINNANFKVNGQIDQASISVCRNISLSSQRGMLSGIGSLTGNVFVNSGTISPDAGATLTLGSLTLNSADPINGTLGSLVQIQINSGGASQVLVNGAASLAGTLEIALDPNYLTGTYTILTSSGITGTFDSVVLTGPTADYSLSYLPLGAPTFVELYVGSLYSTAPLPTQGLQGNSLKVANYLNVLTPSASLLGLTEQIELLGELPSPQYQAALNAISPSRNSISSFVAQNMMFMCSESLDSHFTTSRLSKNRNQPFTPSETALLASNEPLVSQSSPRKIMQAPPPNTHSQIWSMGFGQFGHQNSQDQTPAFNFNSGGLFAAYDYGNIEQGCIGALAGYAHASTQQDESMGSGILNTGYISIYGTRSFSDFFIDAAILGACSNVDQKRIISFPGFDGTAKSSFHSGQLDLHFRTGYDFNINTGTIEPFGLLDCVFEWDPSYKEKGAAPYSMKVSSRNSWMLRFETGLNGYQTSHFSWGVFIAQAKLSYVYKKPHNVGRLQAAFVDAASSFVVEAFTAEQNLISPAAELFFQTNWNGYGSISYNGEFGSGYYSNQFYGKIGYSF